MQVNGPTSVQPAQLHGAQPISGPHSPEPTARPSAFSGADEVQISAEADMLSRVHDVPEVRQDRIDSIRASIAQGDYETPEKLDLALERMLDEMA